MANPNLKGGFQFVRRLNGSSKAPECVEYPLATTNEPLCKGDLVSMLAAGSVDRTCTDASDHDEDSCFGVCESILYKNAAGELMERPYVAASQGDDTTTLGNGTGGIVRVRLLQGSVWSVQCDDGGSTAISQALVGTACNPLAAAATDPTVTGTSAVSNQELDTSDAGTDAGTFHIIGLHKKVGMVFSSTEADSRYGRVLVTTAEDFFGVIPTISGI